MVSLILGLIWGVAVFVLAFTSAIKDGAPTFAVALAGVGLALKSYLIFTLTGGA